MDSYIPTHVEQLDAMSPAQMQQFLDSDLEQWEMVESLGCIDRLERDLESLLQKNVQQSLENQKLMSNIRVLYDQLLKDAIDYREKTEAVHDAQQALRKQDLPFGHFIEQLKVEVDRMQYECQSLSVKMQKGEISADLFVEAYLPCRSAYHRLRGFHTFLQTHA